MLDTNRYNTNNFSAKAKLKNLFSFQNEGKPKDGKKTSRQSLEDSTNTDRNKRKRLCRKKVGLPQLHCAGLGSGFLWCVFFFLPCRSTIEGVVHRGVR